MSMETKQRIILIDIGHFIHATIFNNESMYRRKAELEQSGQAEQASKILVLPPVYSCMASIIAGLKGIGVNSDCDDKVIACFDNTHKTEKNWRKQIFPEYKADRVQKHDYSAFNDFEDKIEQGTPFFVLSVPGLEADDLIAESCTYFKDQECIILGQDHDYDQLLQFDNVKIFVKNRFAKNCPYRILDLDREKEIKKAYRSLQKKILKEKTDNLLGEINNVADSSKHEMCVRLTKLPDFVSSKILPELDKIKDKIKEEFDITRFSAGIQKRFFDIYDDKNIITYEQCRVVFARKTEKKKKKDKEKRLAKKEKIDGCNIS